MLMRRTHTPTLTFMQKHTLIRNRRLPNNINVKLKVLEFETVGSFGFFLIMMCHEDMFELLRCLSFPL